MMSNMEESRISLGTRQVDVQRGNLVQMCRLTVKSLIDKSSFEPVDDSSDELVNFFAVMEQLLLFRMKPQKTWYGTAEPRHYWEYIKVACRKLSNNCITNIESIENIRTNRGKGRAWLRVALMEKRLSEYFSNALSQTRVTKNFYHEGSVMMSEDSSMLCGTLLGLNAIDFSFCLKGDNLELMGPLTINYSPYLLFHHNDESLRQDSEELELSYSNVSSSIMSEVDEEDASWSVKYKSLENKFKTISEQKGYLEELVRLRQSQLEEATRQRRHLLDTLEHYEAEAMRERQQLEGVIIELQGQLASLKEQMKTLQRELKSLRARVLPQPDSSAKGSSKPALAMREISEEPSVRLPRQLLTSQDSDLQSQTSSEMGSTGNVSHHLMVSTDPRSSLSQSGVKEETQSLVPLAGSFSSELSFKSGDIQMTALPKTTSGLSYDNDTVTKESSGTAESVVQISVSDMDKSNTGSGQDPLQVDVSGGEREVAGSAAQPLKEENGNTVDKDTTEAESPEVRSSPDGEVSDEEKTILSAIVGGSHQAQSIATDEQQRSGDDSFSSDDGRAPPREMTVEESSSDNSNGEWTLLPRTGEAQDQSSPSGEDVAVPRDSSETAPDDITPDQSHQYLDTH